MLKVEYILYTYLYWNMDISSSLLLGQGMLIFIFSIADCTVESRERILCVFCPHSCTFIVVGRRHCFPFDWRIPEARCECCSMAAAGPGVQEPGDICTPGSSRGQVGQLAPGLTSSCETVVTLGDTGGKVRVQATGQCTVYSGAAAGADMWAMFDYIMFWRWSTILGRGAYLWLFMHRVRSSLAPQTESIIRLHSKLNKNVKWRTLKKTFIFHVETKYFKCENMSRHFL